MSLKMSLKIPSYLPQIYPIYTLQVFTIAIILSIFGVYIGKNIDTLFAKIDTKNKNKYYKQTLAAEVCIQIGLCAVLSYVSREIIDMFSTFMFGSYLIGKPSKYAVIIMAPSMFIPQIQLADKIKYIIGI
tara:strand:- start:124 stop:513 length:390 start_codon:yes stop_codon:yes gene_type:complete